MIDKWLNRLDQFDPRNLFWGVITISILLAAWMQYIQHGWINPDSVIYFEQARLFAKNDWQGMLGVYQWPFYSACIGIVHKLTSLSIQASAQLLNMLFFGLATASFLRLITLAGGSNRTLIMGMLLLFSSQYIVGDVLEMLMRDEGFWAFYLTALVFFIRYIQHQKRWDALHWQLCIIIATLFRIEAILFLLFLPLACLLDSSTQLKTQLRKLLNAYSISIFIGIVISFAVIALPQLSMSQFGRLNEVFTNSLYQEFTKKLFLQSDIMSHQVLGRYLAEFAIPGLLLTFIYVIGSKIITATGFVGIGLVLIGTKCTSIEIKPTVKRVLLVVGSIALISMLLIIIKVFVLSSRYAVALAWILLIFASFYLSTLSLNPNKKPRMVFIFICLILGLSLVKNILPKREGYNFRQDAVAWIKKHNTNNSPVFYDDTRMIYYANISYKGNWGDNWKVVLSAIEKKTIQMNPILAISHSKKHAERLDFIDKKLTEFKEVKRFSNRKAKKFIVIYQLKNTK